MVRLFCSSMQVNGETHETMISVFSNADTTSFMINIKGLDLNQEHIDDVSMQWLAEEVAQAVQQSQSKLERKERPAQLRAV
jgi:hypothetical protein